MKKKSKIPIIIFLIIIIVLGIVLFPIIKERMRIAKIKSSWYLEVTHDYINVREQATAWTNVIGKVEKGEVFAILDYEVSGNTYWYKIRLSSGDIGWVANPVKTPYLETHNLDKDIEKPIITFTKDEYKVNSIEDINYKHLKVSDDSGEYEITHKVYYEEKEDQYWIVYRAEDKAGNYAEKTQSIIFKTKPSSSKVLDFDLISKE